MNGRRIYWPRGKTLGGSSSINGLIYIRGQREDYDHWAALGNAGWGYDDVLPYFIKSEANERGAIPLHGAAGPLKVSDIGARHELIEAFIDGRPADRRAAPPTTSTGAQQEGAGYYQLTTHKGWRISTAESLPRSGPRPPEPAHRDRRVRGRSDHGRHARRRRTLSARRRDEGGALPGRGAAVGRLAAIAAAAAALGHRPARAARKARHPGGGRFVWRRRKTCRTTCRSGSATKCAKPITTNDQLNSIFGQMKIGLQWLLLRSGPLAIGINQGGCFMRALRGADGNPEAATPDIQFHVATLSADMAGGKVHPYSGFTMSICQLRPEARGPCSHPLRPIRSSRPRCSRTTCRPSWTAAPPWRA